MHVAAQEKTRFLCRGPFLCDHLQWQLLRGFFFFGFAVVPQYLQLLECSIEGRMAVPTGVRVAVRIRPLLAREVGKLA